MNITVVGVNYFPEDSAIGLYSTQMAEFLSENSHNVSVITGFPYYPKWKIKEDYKDKPSFYKEKVNNVNIYRYKLYVPSKPSFLKRIIHLISFTLGSFVNVFKVKKSDAIIVVVPFTSAIILGLMLKLRFRSKLWVHIQDFEFDAAIDSGIVKRKQNIIFKFLIFIEKALLKQADQLSTISNGMLNKLKLKTKKEGYYLPNWLDASIYDENNKIPHKYLKSNKFKILYSGNIGAKQDWDAFFSFIDRVKDYSDVEVVVVGEGAKQDEVKIKLKAYNFVSFHNLVPYNELGTLLSSADLHVLFQKDEVIDTVMPSKILGMMGSGKPSIVTGNKNSEVREILTKSKGGFYFENNEINKIIETISLLKDDRKMLLEYGKNAKQFITENFSKEKVLKNFLKELNKYN